MFYLKRFWVAWTNISLVLRICIGLVLGAILGVVVPEWSGISVFGNIFVSALKAIAPILVAVLVTSSIAKATGSVGNRFSVVIGQYLLSTFIAALCAVVVDGEHTVFQFQRIGTHFALVGAIGAFHYSWQCFRRPGRISRPDPEGKVGDPLR